MSQSIAISTVWNRNVITSSVLSKGRAVIRKEHRTPAGRNDQPFPSAQLGGEFSLLAPEQRLPVLAEDLPDRGPQALGEDLVHVHELAAQPPGQLPAHRSLARAHESRDDDIALCTEHGAFSRLEDE